MLLATLGQDRDGMRALHEWGKAKRVVLVRASAGIGGWGRAGVIPFILPTSSGVDIEPPSVHSPAARTVDWHAHLCIVLVG
jgi:hypothetical protein